jgi:hypothetical protein
MIAGLDKQELVRLELSAEEISSELKWKHSREFEYNGEMYDIVYIEASADSTVFHCWWDHEETTLNQQLKSLLAIAFNKDPLKKDRQDRLSLFLKHLYFNAEEQSLEMVSLGSTQDRPAPSSVLSPFLKVESPPPIV